MMGSSFEFPIGTLGRRLLTTLQVDLPRPISVFCEHNACDDASSIASVSLRVSPNPLRSTTVTAMSNTSVGTFVRIAASNRRAE
jgi:hypothetical protein